MPLLLEEQLEEINNNHMIDILKVEITNPSDANKLADFLRDNTSIKYLKMSNFSNIGDKEIQYIADSLKENKALTCLNLSYSNLNNDGLKIIISSLKENSSIAFLDLSENSIDHTTTNAVAEILKNNNTLAMLAMYNSINEPKILDEIVISLENNENIIGILGANDTQGKIKELCKKNEAKALEYIKNKINARNASGNVANAFDDDNNLPASVKYILDSEELYKFNNNNAQICDESNKITEWGAIHLAVRKIFSNDENLDALSNLLERKNDSAKEGENDLTKEAKLAQNLYFELSKKAERSIESKDFSDLDYYICNQIIKFNNKNKESLKKDYI